MTHRDSGHEVLLQDVGPRDGLQSEPVALSPGVRARLVERLARAGLRRIQIGSFVNPRLVPQMAGTDELWEGLARTEGVRYSVLVLGERGLEQALEAGIPHVEIYVSASETHSRKNTNTTVEESLEKALRMMERIRGGSVGVTAGVMCAFGCAYEGAVPVEQVARIVTALKRGEPSEIGLADTTGMADPEGIRRVVSAVAGDAGMDRITLHLHDTRGMGIANLKAALDLGVRRFDASVGGLGGCPFVPGAKGNISTEEAVETIESMGFSTGVDRKLVGEIAADLAGILERGGEQAGMHRGSQPEY